MQSAPKPGPLADQSACPRFTHLNPGGVVSDNGESLTLTSAMWSAQAAIRVQDLCTEVSCRFDTQTLRVGG